MQKKLVVVKHRVTILAHVTASVLGFQFVDVKF
jgi:hypothetical protein